MYKFGFITDSKILGQKVPENFIEPKGTFSEYLREYYEKDGKVLFHLNRKGDNAQQYSPSEIEIETWKGYFGEENFVDFYEQLRIFKPELYENEII
jgi:hypothetical protein